MLKNNFSNYFVFVAIIGFCLTASAATPTANSTSASTNAGPCGATHDYTNNNNGSTSDPNDKTHGKGATQGIHTMASDFGQRDCANCSDFHKGVDISVKNLPASEKYAYSFMSGTVDPASGNKGGATGNMLIINNGNGLRTVFMHSDGFLVTAGQQVVAGQAIADYTGIGTGAAAVNGAHIHYQMEVNVNGVWTKVDPVIVEALIRSGTCPGADLTAKAVAQTVAAYGLSDINDLESSAVAVDICAQPAK